MQKFWSVVDLRIDDSKNSSHQFVPRQKNVRQRYVWGRWEITWKLQQYDRHFYKQER
jgi:hypothetical protein